MDIYNAMMKAADHIESHPEYFRFREVHIPKTCDTPGCAIGWIHKFSGLNSSQLGMRGYLISAARVLPGIHSDEEFYDRMDQFGSRDWRVESSVCAKALRLYANKYLVPAKAARRPTSALVADLMVKVHGAPIPEDVVS